jgi:hypothetical protein
MKTRNPLTKLLPAFTLASIFSICVPLRINAQTTNIHTKGDVLLATFGAEDDPAPPYPFWSPVGPVHNYISVQAHRSGDSTFLFFGSYSQDRGYDTLVVNGYGYISNADFVVTGPTATLNRELANYPGFSAFAQLYTNAFVPIWEIPITSGSINLLLKKNQSFSSSFNGIETDTYDNVTLRQQMSTSYAATSLNGTFFRYVVPSDSLAQIGDESSNVITITKK